jgi:hypothetical protein
MKKLNAKKQVVSVLTLAAVVALAGSLSGTMAWFQYSTRATVAYTGTAAHASENLQISLDGSHWVSDLTTSDIRDYVISSHTRVDTALRPVTTGVQEKDAPLNTLYKNPIRQHARMSEWKEAEKTDYITLPIQIRALDVNGGNEKLLAKDIYLSDLTVEEKPVGGKLSIVDALRVHFNAGDDNYLFSAQGGSVNTHGNLDLNGDGSFDLAEGYDFHGARSYVDYGVLGEKAAIGELSDLQVGDFYKITTSDRQTWDPVNEEWIPDPASTTDTYYKFDGKKWVTSDAAPTGDGVTDKGVAANVAALPELRYEGDVYKVGEKFYRCVKTVDELNKKYILGWEEFDNYTSESYKIEGSSFIADDTDPYDIEGTPIASTYASVSTLNDLVLDKDYYYVDVAGEFYQFVDNAWSHSPTLPAEGRDQGKVDVTGALPTIPTASTVSYVKDEGVTKKWDATAKQWVVNADFTVAALEVASSVKDKTYFLSADNGGYKKGIYLFDGAGFIRQAESLTINVTIYLEGWQELRPTAEEDTTDDVLAKTTTKQGTIYQVGTQFKTWTGSSLEDGKLKLVDGQWVEGSTETPISAGAWPNTADWVKTGESFYITDMGRTLRWSGTQWIEGAASVWDAGSYVGSAFNIGFRFTAEAHNDHR